MERVRSESISPNLTIRNLTLLSLSAHDALNLVEKRYQTYATHEPSRLTEWNKDWIVYGCGWQLGTHLHPANQGKFDQISSAGLREDADPVVRNSFLFGARVARAYLEGRKADGSTTTITYFPRTAPGQWRRTPSFFKPPEQPHWRKVKPFGIPDLKPFLPPPPPAHDSPEFVQALREVKEIGGKNSRLRTAEQTFLAKFWKDFSYTQTPPGHWNDIADFAARAQEMDLHDEARLFALLNLSLADAGIVAWECTSRHPVWRPVHAIRLAKQFPATAKLAQADWEPLIETPAHPEYVSAHSCFSGAASQVLTHVLGSDSFTFLVRSDQYPGQRRKFDRFSDCLKEIGESRVHGGIHYRFSNERGIEAGKKIGAFICNNMIKSLTR